MLLVSIATTESGDVITVSAKLLKHLYIIPKTNIVFSLWENAMAGDLFIAMLSLSFKTIVFSVWFVQRLLIRNKQLQYDLSQCQRQFHFIAIRKYKVSFVPSIGLQLYPIMYQESPATSLLIASFVYVEIDWQSTVNRCS